MDSKILEALLKEKQQKVVKKAASISTALLSPESVTQALQTPSTMPTNGHVLGVRTPYWAAANTINYLLYGPEHSSTENAIELCPQVGKRVLDSAADFTTEAHKSLMSQIATLEAAFNKFLSLSALCTDPEISDRYASLAFRAQDQCRKCWVSLSEIKSPKRATFIKQATAIGQQVNQLKLEQQSPLPILETQPYAAMDARSQKEAVRVDSHLATVEPIDRPKKRGRKSKSSSEQL